VLHYLCFVGVFVVDVCCGEVVFAAAAVAVEVLNPLMQVLILLLEKMLSTLTGHRFPSQEEFSREATSCIVALIPPQPRSEMTVASWRVALHGV